MTTPFTTYAFQATGAPTNRTLPARLAETKSVKDFGAVGNGIADDLAAIMAAFNWASSFARGTVYFPPGTYRVSAPIDVGLPLYLSASVSFLGCGATSIIIGNFADYVIKRGSTAQASTVNGGTVQFLTIINQHASGGGIRWGLYGGAAVRFCNVTANFGINFFSYDVITQPPQYSISFEVSCDNCIVRPFTALTAGSFGIAFPSDGPVRNCSVIGFDTGMLFASGQGGGAVQGCYFEGNNTGAAIGVGPLGQTTIAVAAVSLLGCRFKNNKIGIDCSGAVISCFGVLVEAANGSIPGNPQYGIRVRSGLANHSLFAGSRVTGDYAVAAISVDTVSTSGNRPGNTFMGVSAVNTGAGVVWNMPTTAFTADFFACNTPPVFTLANLPAKILPITAMTWAAAVITGLGSRVGGSGYVNGTYSNIPLTGGSGTGAIATVVVAGGAVTTVAIVTVFGSAGGLYNFNQSGGTNFVVGDTLSANAANLGGSGSGFSINVTEVTNLATVTTSAGTGIAPGALSLVGISGVTPSGYNTAAGSTADATGLDFAKFLYEVASNPGAYTSGGSAFITTFSSGGPNCFEGYTYNISNANSSTWGAALPSSTGTTRAKVRYTPTAWTVVGK